MLIELKSIKVQNFLSYGKNLEHNSFEFKNGLDLVTATNGSGKSAIFLDSINYALFGKPFRKIKLQSLQNNINTKELLVNLEFKANDRDYKIIRGMNPSIFEIYEEGVLLPEESTIKSYQSMLEENILGISEDIFRSLIALSSGSNSSKCFLDLSVKEREEIFNYLIDTKIFQDLTDITKKHINSHKTFNTEFEYKTKILSDFLNSEKERITEINTHNKKLQEDKEKDISLSKEKIQALKEKNTKIEKALEKESLFKEKLSFLDSIIASHKDTIEKSFTRMKEIEEKLLLIESAKKTAITCSDCGSVNYTIKIDQSLIDSESELERSRRVLDKNIAETKDELEEAREEKDEYKTKLNKLEILKREFSKNNKDILSLEDRIKDLENSEILSIDTSSYKAKKQEFEEVKAELLQNKDKLEKYQWIHELVSKNTLKGEVISSQIPLLNKYINDFLEKFDMNSYSIVIGKDFKEKIISRNSVTEFSQLSNGQKMRLDFSIRFGFIKLMEQRNSVNTNLLVLDESLDSSIDATGREELLEILKSEFADTKDIIIVSHNQEIKEKEEIFDRNINITKDKFSKIVF